MVLGVSAGSWGAMLELHIWLKTWEALLKSHGAADPPPAQAARFAKPTKCEFRLISGFYSPRCLLKKSVSISTVRLGVSVTHL